jgi:hypothetical protein
LSVTPKIRLEIILPLNYNNGAKIEISKFLETQKELSTRFGGCTFITGATGTWISNGVKYDDINTIFFVDAPNNEHTIAFFRDYKEQLKTRFEQLDIKITVFEIGEI